MFSKEKMQVLYRIFPLGQLRTGVIQCERVFVELQTLNRWPKAVDPPAFPSLLMPRFHESLGFRVQWEAETLGRMSVPRVCLWEINGGRHLLICLRPGWFFSPDGRHLMEGILSPFPLCQRGVEVVRAVTGLWRGVLGARVCWHVWRPRGQCRVWRAHVSEHWALCLQQGRLCSFFDDTVELVDGRGEAGYYKGLLTVDTLREACDRRRVRKERRWSFKSWF